MDSLSQILHTISFVALPLLLAIILHEYAHGWVANYYGDPTARLLGRLTVNPIPHIDPIGSILLPLICVILPGSFFIGWAKPVPINSANFQDPRRHMALVAAAGPAMNLFLPIVSALLLSLIFTIDPTLAAYWPPQSGVGLRDDLLGMLLLPIAAMALFSVLINILLMVLNLIPVPPLDGGRILVSLLPAQSAQALRRVEPIWHVDHPRPRDAGAPDTVAIHDVRSSLPTVCRHVFTPRDPLSRPSKGVNCGPTRVERHATQRTSSSG